MRSLISFHKPLTNMTIEKRTENFLKKSRRKYGKNFNYSEMMYTNLNTQIILQCRTHYFSFSIKPQNHLKQKYGGCKKCHKNRNNFVVSDRRNFEVVFTCGHTFLSFCDLLDLNTLFQVDSYANKQVTEYVEKTNQENLFCYVNKLFFKKYTPRSYSKKFPKGRQFTETTFYKVAYYGNLNLMKWIRKQSCPWSSSTFCSALSFGKVENMMWLKEEGCPWSGATFSSAAQSGNLDNMKWLKEEGCPWGGDTFYKAAQSGNLDNMKWLKAEGCPWSEHTFACTTDEGNLEIIRWLTEEDCPWDEWVFSRAASHGNLKNMKFLYEAGCPWGESTFECAAENTNLQNMKWLKEQGCPWNEWTFEKIVLNGNWDIKFSRDHNSCCSHSHESCMENSDSFYNTKNKVLNSMKWLREEGCPWDAKTFENAAEVGILENMKWLREEKCPWNAETFSRAVGNGNFDNMKWLREEKCLWDAETFNTAVGVPENLEHVKWLKEEGCPWDKKTLQFAYFNCQNTFEIMKWLLENKCIWNYEVFCDIVKFVQDLFDNDYNVFLSLVEDGCISREEYNAFLSRAISDGIAQ